MIEACSGGVALLNEESGVFTSMHYGEQRVPIVNNVQMENPGSKRQGENINEI